MSFRKPCYVTRCFLSVALAAILAPLPLANKGFVPHIAQALAQEPIDFRAALEGYGHWVRHPRWGEVWVPDEREADWQPYRAGHWVFTDEWGWYWDSDEDFGWVTYHYGRWLLDRDLGWVWLPGEEWAPAWVNWREGDDFVGWAPQPPDEFIDENENPDTYMFVRARDLLAPEVYTVFIPFRERSAHFHRSRIVNRTFLANGRRVGVNPGISPAFIAHWRGRPFHSMSVAPIVLGGTVGVAGAVMLRKGFHDRKRRHVTVRETKRLFQPHDRFQKSKPLRKGERGRLGDIKLKAAHGGGTVLKRNDGRKNSGPYDNGPNNSAGPNGQKRHRDNGKKDGEKNDTRQKVIQQRSGGGNHRPIETDKKKFERGNNQQQNSQQKHRAGDRKNTGAGGGQGNQQKLQLQNNQHKNMQRHNAQPKMQQHQTQPRVQHPQQQQHIQRSTTPQRGKSQDKDKNKKN